MEAEQDSKWLQLAAKHWRAEGGSQKARNEVIKSEIWDELEKSGFASPDLVALENAQLLEQYLWPSFSNTSSDHHVLLIAVMITTKRREGLSVWDLFQSNLDGFSSLFHRLLSMSVVLSIPPLLQNHILRFFIAAFQSLEVAFVRKECIPLVSVSIWHHLHSEAARDAQLEQAVLAKKAWRGSIRRFEAASEGDRARLVFARSWLYTKLVGFLDTLYNPDEPEQSIVRYCELFLELLTDLESQLPTRRYLNTLLKDLNVSTAILRSRMYQKHVNGIFGEQFLLFRHFAEFPVDDGTGRQHSLDETAKLRSKALASLQRTALKSYKDKLSLLALSSYGTLSQRSELENHFSALDDEELSRLAAGLGFRTEYPDCKNFKAGRPFTQEVLVSSYEKQPVFQERVASTNIAPTEKDLYDPSLLQNESYDGTRPLAIPKLNLQYLTVGDFLWRSFVLYRCETFFQIRHDIEDVIKRLQPRLDDRDDSIRFTGNSRLALPITRPAILEVAQPSVGQSVPQSVRAEITLNVSRLNANVLSEWDSLKPGDVVYLVAVRPPDTRANGHTDATSARHHGLLHLRTAEVVHLQEEGGRHLKDGRTHRQERDEYVRKPRIRRLIVNIDPAAFAEDQESMSKGKPDIYESMNLIVRRKGRENNFKSVLSSIKQLALADAPAPAWLQDVFLGFGDPSSANYNNLADKLAVLNVNDTFLDWDHVLEAFPGKKVETDISDPHELKPPYLLQSVSTDLPAAQRPTKKRRKDEQGASVPLARALKVSCLPSLNTGPYPGDAPKRNSVRFTPAQTEAIVSGTQPGLTVIVGPPGTGKTDVATQIINNLYHNFPEQRTLLIAHSNQALNQLFQKITKLDVDRRHLLRLGHGEESLETEESFGKHGRVESFLDNRSALLSEVNRLAMNLGAPGAHGNSCETAGYFQAVYVAPQWTKFWAAVEGSETPAETIRASFPFYQYFSNAPQPLFPDDKSDAAVQEIARGCELHIGKIFSELEDIRPFELLRSARDRANYLLIKEARIIAMTSTHAAMRRQEIADMGFHYDNVVMEEAAQITEIENFIPLALQNAKHGILPLKRLVMCGDHYQNSPIIQNIALRQFANFEQSMFLRFVRLGVPVIDLDKQGRARSSIADLYRWRYQHLGDLPNVLADKEFKTANAGLRYDWQFIDVPDYKGEGEMQPTPHFIQNLGEAEYAVALYQYMRLLGYPARKITILTTYAGQRALITDVLQHRCAHNRLFGMPRHVVTVDKYQGEQNDYVILSLVRSKRVGYLRDIRRLTVALSRARLGLYVLGRKQVFESCFELREAFSRLLQRPTTLQVVPGELFPSKRNVDAKIDSTEMTGLEHLGQYVYEMTQAKLQQMDTNIEEPEEVGNGVSLGETSAEVEEEDAEEEEEEDEEEEEEGGVRLKDGAEEDEGNEIRPEELED